MTATFVHTQPEPLIGRRLFSFPFQPGTVSRFAEEGGGASIPDDSWLREPQRSRQGRGGVLPALMVSMTRSTMGKRFSLSRMSGCFA